MANVRTSEIIRYAKDIRKAWGSDPFKIAEQYGINVFFMEGSKPAGYTVQAENYPTIINISGVKSELAGKVICAHELGHALLHEGVNYLDGTNTTLMNDIEYEANLFAVALLVSDEKLNVPLESMSSYMLKEILDYNL